MDADTEIAFVVSDPPHRDQIDVEVAAELLGLDVFAMRLKARFTAPEVLLASEPAEATDLAAALGGAGYVTRVVHGAALADLPWPDPVHQLVLDETNLIATLGEGRVELAYDTELLGVYCRPPADHDVKPTVDVEQAMSSGHGPFIAEAIQGLSFLDLYFRDSGSVRRISLVFENLGLSGEEVLPELTRRFSRMHLDARMAGLRPRARYGKRHTGAQLARPSPRRGYSFGTARLYHALESIAGDMRDLTQYELGSRLAFALSPMWGQADAGGS